MQKHRSITTRFAFVILAIPLLACGFSQQILPETLTPTLTLTRTLTPTSTPKPTSTPRPTATANLAATQQYEEFLPLVQEYHDAKLIPSTEGNYHRLPDYSDALAQANYFQWATVGKVTRNFILRSHVKMSTENEFSASTGCGFVFRAFGDYTQAIYVKQGGSIFYLIDGTIWHKQYYKTFSNPTEFDLVFIAHETRMNIYVDGNPAFTYGTFLDTRAGDLGFTVTSGSDENESQCEFTNNELWVIKE